MDRKRRLSRPLIWVAVLALLLAAGCERPSDAPSSPISAPRGDSHVVLGAGATFPAPVHEQWSTGVHGRPGQASAGRLHCTPVPRDLRESVAAKIRLLHDPDGRLLTS